MTGPAVSYVALISRDVPAACRLLGEVLGLRRSVCSTEDGDVPVFAVGAAALALFGPGDRFVDGTVRTGVHHIGLDFGGVVVGAVVGAERVGAGWRGRRGRIRGRSLGSSRRSERGCIMWR
jgi:hypothetical protein